MWAARRLTRSHRGSVTCLQAVEMGYTTAEEEVCTECKRFRDEIVFFPALARKDRSELGKRWQCSGAQDVLELSELRSKTTPSS